MKNLWQDFRFGLRMLRRNPAHTVVAVLALALGIGATSAIFSVVNAVLLRPFPFDDPDRLVMVWERQLQLNLPLMNVSPPNYADWVEQNEVFADLGAFTTSPFFLTEGEQALHVEGARVTASVFPTLGVEPLVGRVFTTEEDAPGQGKVVLLSHRLWQAQFGGDRSVVGRVISVNDENRTVVGVMPPGFDFPPAFNLEGTVPTGGAAIWAPFEMDMAAGQRGAHFMDVVARLGDGVSLERADAEMKAVASRLEGEYPDSNGGWDTTLVPMEEQALGSVRGALFMLLGAVALVLLIACVNVANLLLARGTARQQEFAVRAALGAGKPRLVRQLLTESVTLALIGGGLGLLLALLGMKVLVLVAPQNVPRLHETSLDFWVVGFTVLVSLLTGVLFGLAPALQTSSADFHDRLKEGGHGQDGGRGSRRVRAALVVSEVALSLVLLVGAGLLFRSFVHLQEVETGFQAADALTARVTLPKTRYPEQADRARAFQRLQEVIVGLPGIDAAGFIYDIPLSADRQGTTIIIEGQTPPADGNGHQVNFSIMTPGYLRSMGIPLLQGRGFTPRDTADSEDVVIINQTAARRFFGDDDPLGHRLVAGMSYTSQRRIVGVVGDVRHDTLRTNPSAIIYVPYYDLAWARSLSLVVRSEIGTADVLAMVRQEISRFDPAIPLYEVKTIDQVVAESLAQQRFSMLMLVVFSAVALLLASIGIYGVISYSVGRRLHETGIRMALGAKNGDILRLVVGQGLRLAVLGVSVGLLAALAVSRALSPMLFGVSSTDFLTFAAVAALLVAVATLASYVPARRATRVDPMEALRYE